MADGIKKVSENVIIDKRALVITDPLVPDNDAISIGALQSNPTTRGLKIKTSKNTYSLFDASEFIMPGTITTPLLKDKCVTTIKLDDKSVTGPKLSDDAVSTRTLIDFNVTESKLGPKSVTESKVGDQALVNRHYKDLSITNSKLENNTIQNSKLEDKTITNQKIADATIISSLIANTAIKNVHMDINSVDHLNLIDYSVYGNKIKLKGIEQKHLADNSVNTINILNGAVTGIKIPDREIVERHLAMNSVGTSQLIDASVTNLKLGDLSVSTSKIVNKSITKEKLGDDVIGLIGDPVQYDHNNDVTLRKNLTVNGDINATGTITAKRIYNAVFMDIAEAYKPKAGCIYVPGDIVQLNEQGEIERGDSSHFVCNLPIVGVVSDEYATCYGATEEELETGEKIAVGLIGKVHVNVIGPVTIGDKIGLLKNGMGASTRTNNIPDGSVIGKALETSTEEGLKKVLCLIYPN